KDCRESFMSIGSAVGMTSKSVKARVDAMISTGVIEKFVVKVNPVAPSLRKKLLSLKKYKDLVQGWMIHDASKRVLDEQDQYCSMLKKT
ncbi:MAG TPA: hypothetical protein VIP70_02780, partial [Nitrososphaeraceae archaeon]